MAAVGATGASAAHRRSVDTKQLPAGHGASRSGSTALPCRDGDIHQRLNPALQSPYSHRPIRGYLARTHNPVPDNIVMWRGLAPPH